MNLIIISINIDINKKKDEILSEKSSLTEMKDSLTDQLFSELSAAISAEIPPTFNPLAVRITPPACRSRSQSQKDEVASVVQQAQKLT